MGRDLRRQGGFLRWRQLARPVTSTRAGADLAGAATPDQRLVDIGYADPKHPRRRPRRHAAVDRRQNPRSQVLRITLSLPPSHRRPTSCGSASEIILYLSWESPSAIPGNAAML